MIFQKKSLKKKNVCIHLRRKQWNKRSFLNNVGSIECQVGTPDNCFLLSGYIFSEPRGIEEWRYSGSTLGNTDFWISIKRWKRWVSLRASCFVLFTTILVYKMLDCNNWYLTCLIWYWHLNLRPRDFMYIIAFNCTISSFIIFFICTNRTVLV